MTITAIALVLLLVWVGAIYDLRVRRIPNWLSLSAAGAGVALHTVFGGIAGIGTAISGVAVGLALLLPGFLARATGPGDVKLLAAAGALLGPYWIFVGGLISIVAGACLAVAVAAAEVVRSGARGPWQRYGLMLKTLAVTGRVSYIRPPTDEAMGRTFPFGIAIAAGVTTAALWSRPTLLQALTAGGFSS